MVAKTVPATSKMLQLLTFLKAFLKFTPSAWRLAREAKKVQKWIKNVPKMVSGKVQLTSEAGCENEARFEHDSGPPRVRPGVARDVV